MNVLERQKLILDLLQKTEYLSPQELTNYTHSSIATVRRDLKELGSAGRIRRFRGGVALAENPPVQHPETADHFGDIEEHKNEKVRIAREAAAHIVNEDVVFLDGGSTIHYMPDYISAENIKIVTNSLLIAQKALAKNLSVYILAGDIRPGSQCTYHRDTLQNVLSLNLNKSFIGSRGIDLNVGFTSPDSSDSAVKAAAISRSQESFILADHSKFNVQKLYTFASIDDVTLITGDCEYARKYRGRIITV